MNKNELIELLQAIPGNPEVMSLSKPTVYTGVNAVHVIDLPYKNAQAILLQPLGISLSDSILYEKRPDYALA